MLIVDVTTTGLHTYMIPLYRCCYLLYIGSAAEEEVHSHHDLKFLLHYIVLMLVVETYRAKFG